MDASIDRAFTGDLVVDSGGEHQRRRRPATGRRGSGSCPRWPRRPACGVAPAQVDGTSVLLGAVDPATAFGLLDLSREQGTPEALMAPRRHRRLRQDGAGRRGCSVGIHGARAVQGHRPAAADGRDDLRRGARGQRAVGTYFVGTPTYDGQRRQRRRLEGPRQEGPGRPRSPQARAAVERGRSPPTRAPRCMDKAAVQPSPSTQPLNQMLALVYALLGLAIVIALLGIGNTLALSIVGADPRDRAAAGGRHDPQPAARHDPLGVGDHRAPGHAARAAARAVPRLGAGDRRWPTRGSTSSPSPGRRSRSSSCSPAWPAWSPPCCPAGAPPSSTSCVPCTRSSARRRTRGGPPTCGGPPRAVLIAQLMMPRRKPVATASARSFAPSLRNSRRAWVLMVSSDR